MYRLLVLALLLLPLSSQANSIYRTVDAQGNVVFTDAPPADTEAADRVEIQRINTSQPPPELPPPASPEQKAAEPKAPLYTLTIIAPPTETTFPMGPGNFSVSVRVSPGLKKYQGFQLFIDGEPRGDPQLATSWDLTNVFRGQHDLTVGVVDKHGETLALSPPVRVYVFRPSVNFRK